MIFSPKKSVDPSPNCPYTSLMKIALEINGKRYESDIDMAIPAIEDMLVQAGILEEGDILEVLERDQDYILHKY